MIDEGITVPWGAQVRTDVVRDPELMELMRASKCDFVALGLESVNQATLDGFEKSQTVGDIEHAIKVLHDYGIRAHGMFVLGADHDTPDSVRDTVKFAKKNKIDTVMLNILTPLPGTQQFEELERRGPHHRARLVVLRRAARRVPAQADDAVAPAAGDDQGQQALLRHLAAGLGVPQVAVAARRRPQEEARGTACSSTAGSGTTRARGGPPPRTGRSAAGSGSAAASGSPARPRGSAGPSRAAGV